MVRGSTVRGRAFADELEKISLGFVEGALLSSMGTKAGVEVPRRLGFLRGIGDEFAGAAARARLRGGKPLTAVGEAAMSVAPGMSYQDAEKLRMLQDATGAVGPGNVDLVHGALGKLQDAGVGKEQIPGILKIPLKSDTRARRALDYLFEDVREIFKRGKSRTRRIHEGEIPDPLNVPANRPLPDAPRRKAVETAGPFRYLPHALGVGGLGVLGRQAYKEGMTGTRHQRARKLTDQELREQSLAPVPILPVTRAQ